MATGFGKDQIGALDHFPLGFDDLGMRRGYRNSYRTVPVCQYSKGNAVRHNDMPVDGVLAEEVQTDFVDHEDHRF